jgi:two-component system NtrC family sensor kinase
MKKRIYIGLILLLSIFAAGSMIAVVYVMKTSNRMDRLIVLHQVEILREDLIILIQQVQSSIYRNRTRSSSDADLLVAHVQEMDRAMNTCTGCHEQHSPELKQGLQGMRDMADDYKEAISRLFTASANPRRIEALERRVLQLGQDLISMSQGMAFTANVRLQQKTQETMAVVREVKVILTVTLVTGFLLAIITAYGLAKSLDRPLQRLLDATRKIARGDLHTQVYMSGEEGQEFKELGDAFNAMTKNLALSQRQLIQSTKLAAIGELATNIAYEVNNPLTGVLGYAGLLLRSDDVPPEKKEHLRTIERETLRAREILKNLLDFARRKPPRLVSADICAVIEDALALVRGQAKLCNVEIVSHCADELPPVSVDIDEMKQVFVNLMNNAFFAMPSGGSLTVRCRRDRDIAGARVLVVEFEDTGIGIPEPHLDKIFDPFFTTRVDGEGTGLGLSISYMIVSNHGGRIEVESTVGKGSVFKVILAAEGQ